MKAKDKIHEALCKVAGWPAYCQKCGAKMMRVTNRCQSHSVCSKGCKIEQEKPPYYLNNFGEDELS